MIKDELIRTKNELKEEVVGLVGKENLEEFKAFAFKDRMIQLAIAFILGTSFQKAVNAISQNLIMPFLNYILAKTGADWRQINWEPIDGMKFEVGNFLGSFVDFVLIAFVLYILYYKIVLPFLDKPAVNSKECNNCFMKINLKCQRCPYCTSWI